MYSNMKFYENICNCLRVIQQYINRKLKSANCWQQTSLNEMPYYFPVNVKERKDKLPTMYWLPRLHKRPYKASSIANFSSCTTTELSKLLTSCFTAVNLVSLGTMRQCMKGQGKICFGLLKILVRYLVN